MTDGQFLLGPGSRVEVKAGKEGSKEEAVKSEKGNGKRKREAAS